MYIADYPRQIDSVKSSSACEKHISALAGKRVYAVCVVSRYDTWKFNDILLRRT